MADDKAAFLKARIRGTDEVREYTGYKAMMRDFADPDFREENQFCTFDVERAGKPFISVTLTTSSVAS